MLKSAAGASQRLVRERTYMDRFIVRMKAVKVVASAFIPGRKAPATTPATFAAESTAVRIRPIRS
jgi:hypothetical protein